MSGIVPSIILTVFLGIFALYTSKLLIDFKLNHQVLRILSRTAKKDGPVQIEYRVADGTLETEPQIAAFDELILAIDADSALKLLGKEATWKERRRHLP